MRDIGIGLIGAGFIGAAHGFALRMIADAAVKSPESAARPRLVAVSDASPERAHAFAKNWKCESVEKDPYDLIRRRDVEAVFICTPTDSHAAYVAAAAQARKHIFCEKPLAFTADEAEAMWDAVADAGIVHQVGLVLRFSPVYAVLHALIEEAKTGPLRTVLFRDDQCLPIRGAHRSPWRTDVRQAGGGTLIEHSIHDLDVLRWICGDVTHVRAAVEYFHGHKGIEDYAGVSLDFAPAGSGHLMSLWHDMVARGSNRRLEIFYQRAYFHVEGEFGGMIEYQLGDGELRRLTTAQVRDRALALAGIAPGSPGAGIRLFPYAAEDHAFLAAIAAETPAFPGFEVAFAAHQLVDAVYRSARAQGARTPVQNPLGE